MNQSTENIEDTATLIELETPPAPQLETETLIDGDEIIDEVEELLRENAPHDFEVLIIGSGPGGSTCAMRAAQMGLKVGLVENRQVGGVCLNSGCIPTKTLLESVEVLRLLRRARDYGIETSGAFAPDFSAMTARRDEVVRSLREHLQRQLDENGVQVLAGSARFVSDHKIALTAPDGSERELSAVHIVIATGSFPLRPSLEGADLPGVLTSDELLRETQVPHSMVTIGGGAVGVEFAYLMHELGARSTVIEADAQILRGEDADVAQEMQRLLHSYGIDVRTQTKLLKIEQAGELLCVQVQNENGEQWLECERVLLAMGRRANTQDLDLAAAGIEHRMGIIAVDEENATNVGGVYAIGDCVRGVGWAHQAAGEGARVAEIIAGNAPNVALKHLPSCYYTHPEIASVGLNVQAARERGIEARSSRFDFRFNGRAAASGEHEGWVKLVYEVGSQRLLGCQIIGPRATELINEAVVALNNDYTLSQLVGAVHAHPTFAEALPEAALKAQQNSENERL